mgnify:CR=1 FL=1
MSLEFYRGGTGTYRRYAVGISVLVPRFRPITLIIRDLHHIAARSNLPAIVVVFALRRILKGFAVPNREFEIGRQSRSGIRLDGQVLGARHDSLQTYSGLISFFVHIGRSNCFLFLGFVHLPRGLLGLGLFLLGQNYFDRQVSSLSGGERSRLVLASLFLARANFLVLDEPTNHLDLESREALVEALNAFDGTLLMVAHDRYLLSEVADEAWSMAEDGITVYKEGFAEYDVARRAALAASKAGKEREKDAGRKAEGPVPGKALDREELKRLKREQAEQRNALYKKMRPKQEAYAKLETQLEALLTEQSDVEAALADPEVYADGNKTTELLKKFSQLKESSEQALEKLGELEAELAELEAQRAALSMNGGGDEL